jgi:lysozyme family protein
MSFDKILKKTMKWEGGFVNDVHDRGGATKYGITLGTIQALNEDIDQDGRVDINDIHKLTIKQASSIYERVYFMRPKFHLLPQTIQPVVFDMGVNHGPSRAVKILQKVINTAGITTIEVDGGIGPITIRAADHTNARMGHFFINALCDERQNFYDAIVANDPSQKRFIRGWTNRNNDFRVRS